MPSNLALDLARKYQRDRPALNAKLNKTVLPHGASTRIHLGTGLYHGDGR